MKKLILAVMMMLPVGLAAQSLTFGQIFDKYEGTEGYTIVNMGPEMLSQAAAMAGGEMDEESKSQLNSVMKDVKSFRLLITENAAEQLLAEIDEVMAEGNYQPMVSINDEGEKVLILSSDKSGETGDKEMLLIVQDGAELVFMQILGKMDISEMMKYINLGN